SRSATGPISAHSPAGSARRAGRVSSTATSPSGSSHCTARASRSAESGSARGEPLLLRLYVEVGRRPLRVDLLQRIDQQLLHRKARVPLVVRGHDVPGRLGRGSALEDVTVRLHVVVPEQTFVDVAGVVLPVLV